MKKILICGSEYRHAAYAFNLHKTIKLDGIIIEQKRHQVDDNHLTPIIIEYLSERDKEEFKNFGKYSFGDISTNKFFVSNGSVNSSEVLNWISEINPHVILLYGCSIIGKTLISLYEGRIVNLHLGLSPYYKGAATLFWPIVFNEIQCIGSTFHIASDKVDAGPILQQIRPHFSNDETIHSSGCKVMIESFALAPLVIDKYLNNKIKLISQNQIPDSRVFKKTDFNETSVLIASDNISKGAFKTFYSSKEDLIQKYPIVNSL